MKKKETKEDISRLKKELALWQKKAAENLAGWQRAKADFINFKKQTEESQKEFVQFANAGLILDVIPIYDNLKLAIRHIPEEEKEKEWVKGIFQIIKQFKDILNNLGLEEIKTVNEKFDPEYHEAVIHEKKKGFAKDVIFEEVKPGYKMGDKVLIAARVKVAK